ncbi:hypothetical protein DM02DRAFT_547585, partial [Periconia macrospinosa]
MATDVLPNSANTVAKSVAGLYELDREIVKKKLEFAVSRIHLSLDCWSSPNRKTFLGIVAHFVDDTFQLR